MNRAFDVSRYSYSAASTAWCFGGTLRRLNYGYWDRDLQPLVAQGMEQYLWQNHIRF
jgi:hypothetical protein